MAGNDDIIKAFDALVSGVRSYNISRTMSDAQKAIQDLQATVPDEFKQREAQTKIAQATAARIGELGGNASQMAQTIAALGAAPINTQEASLQSTGASTVAEAVKIREQQAIAKENAASQRDFQERKQLTQMQIDSAERIAGLKANKVKDLPKALQAQFDEFDKTDTELKDLLNKIQNDPNAQNSTGPLAQHIPAMAFDFIPFTKSSSDQVAAFRAQTKQFFDQYRKIITGAGASNQELESLRASTPNVSDTPAQFQAKAERARDIAKSVVQRYAERRARQGYDLKGYEDLLPPVSAPAPNNQQQQQSAPPTSKMGGFEIKWDN